MPRDYIAEYRELHKESPLFCKDGSNLHLNVHPPEWGLDRLQTNLLLDVRFDVT